MTPARNAPCPCGSGRKYKNCCANQATPARRMPWLVAAIVAGGALLVALAVLRPGGSGTSAPPGPAPPGKVWSAEHGHWHDL